MAISMGKERPVRYLKEDHILDFSYSTTRLVSFHLLHLLHLLLHLDADMCICIPIGTKWDFMRENVGLYHLKRSQTREGYGCIEG
jgi:hypothetical protein